MGLRPMHFPRETSNLIASFRGIPADRGRSRPRPAFALGSLIEVLEERYKIGQERIEDVIAHNWKELVGEHAAHRSCPERVGGGAILVIQVGNPVLRQEMQFKQKDILARIHRLPGGQVIQALNFRAG
jgi:hypothetical protein